MKTFHLICIALLGVFTTFTVSAQNNVGIGTTNPNSSSALEIEASNAGLLIPRVSLVSVANGTIPINSPAISLLVYNINDFVVGGNGTGYYYWDGSQWQQLITSASANSWGLIGNAGTNPTTNYIGTSDNQDLSIRTNGSEAVRIDNTGNVGIGQNNPTNSLEVNGSILFNGDFVNQQALGVHSDTQQQVPYVSSVYTPLAGTTVSITVTDGSGINNSAVFITGFARVFGGNLSGYNNSMGSYFIILQRSTYPTFAAPTNLTYTSGTCYMKIPTATGSSTYPYGGGGHLSYLDSGLMAGQTYYYRLVIYPIGPGLTSGTYDIYQRDLIVLQIKR